MNHDIETLMNSGTISVSPATVINNINGPIATYGKTSANMPDLLSQYNSLISKLQEAQSIIENDGATVTISYIGQDGKTANLVFNNESISGLKDLQASVRRWPIARLTTESALVDQMSSYVHPSMGRVPVVSAYATDQFRKVANDIGTAARRANESLLGSKEVSLQIGYMEFSEDDLGPDSVFISEINEVSSLSSLRSRTDIAVKGPGGRCAIEIDIVFSDKNAINNRFRELLGMLKMAPIIPIGGAAFSAVLINRITSTEIFEKIKQKYYSENGTPIRELESYMEDQLKRNYESPSNLDKEALKDIFKLDRAAIEYMLNLPKKSSGQISTTPQQKDAGRAINVNEIIPDSLKTFLIPVVLDSVTVSSVAGMPGAIRARLTFLKHHDITSDKYGLTFIDSNGEPTYDIKQCKPLMDAVETVYLNPRRTRLRRGNKEDIETDQDSINIDYIPLIGDKTSLKINERSVSGTLSGIDPSRILESEMGHNLYTNGLGGTVSPTLIRFATLKDPTTIVEYIPSRMVQQSVTWSMQNKIAMIPMEGEVMPAVQFMGKSGVTGSMTFLTDDAGAIQEFMTVKASLDEISTARSLGQLMRREFLDIYNDVLNLSGCVRFILSSATIQTSPDNPNLYMISVQFVSNEESLEKTEGLQIIENTKANYGQLEELWWWFYGALVYTYEKHNGITANKLISEYIKKSRLEGLSSAAQEVLYKPNVVRTSRLLETADYKTNNNYTSEEIKLILRILKGSYAKVIDPIGWEAESYIKSGLVERNALIAAVSEMVRTENLDSETIKSKISYRNNSDTADITTTMSSFIKDRIVYLSNICEKATSLNQFDDDLDGPNMFNTVFNTIKNVNNRKNIIDGQYVDTMIIHKRNKPIDGTSAVAGSDFSSEYSNVFYDSIYKDMNNLPITGDDSEVAKNLLTSQAAPDDASWAFLGMSRSWMGFHWIPTPELWNMLFKVIMSPGKYKTVRGGDDGNYKDFPAGIHYPTTSKLTYLPGVGLYSGPIYYISKVWAATKDRINAIAVDPSTRNSFFSFFSNPSRNHLYHKIGRAGFSLDEASKHNFLVDPEIFERRNNYTDLALPRYYELFSLNPSDPDPKPRKTIDGFEIWRKVAPTYAEIGEPANIYRALTGLIHSNGKFRFTKPSLLTPRVFNDYCDPGFFYHKSTWINHHYDKLLDDIRIGTTEDTMFMPAGPGGAFKPGWEEIEKMRLLRQDENIPEITLVDMSIADVVIPEAGAEKVGSRTTRIKEDEAVSSGKVSQYIAKLVYKSMNENREFVETGIENLLERMKRNKDKEIRVMVLDNQGTRVGMLVIDKQGERNGSNQNVFKVRVNASGRNEVTIPTSQSGQNALFNGGDFAGRSIKFIDMTSEFNKPADQKSYMSSTQMIKYNEYSKEQAAQILKKQLEFVGDNKLNKSRNYPTFRIYFVKEKVHQNGESYQFMTDDMYGYASVVSMDVMHDKEDASTAVVSLTDITGVLSTSTFRRQIISDSAILGNSDEKDAEDKLNDNLDSPAKIILEVGTNIVIKMGYGQDPEYLKTVFTGAVAEIQPGDITTIVAQSYRTEMFKYVNFYGENGITNWFGSRVMSATDEKNWVHPLFLIHHILVKLARISSSQAPVDRALSLSGLPHFGRFMVMADFLSISNTDKLDFQTEYNKFINKNVPTEQDAQFSVGDALAGSAVVGAGVLSSALILGGPVGWVGMGMIALAGVGAGYYDRYQRYTAKYDDLHIYTNAMRNIMISESFETTFWDYINQEWVADGSGWACLKEVARYKVNHICAEVPYGNQATLFMGKPDNLYHYKPLDRKSLDYYSQVTPIIGKFVADKLNETLIDPFLKSDLYSRDFSYYQIKPFKNPFVYKEIFDDLLEEITAINTMKDKQERFAYPFLNEKFLSPENMPSYKASASAIDKLTSTLFPGVTATEQVKPVPKFKSVGIGNFIRPGGGGSLARGNREYQEVLNNYLEGSSMDTDGLLIVSGVTASSIAPRGTIDPETKIGFVNGKIDASRTIIQMSAGEFSALGYSPNDLVGFKSEYNSFLREVLRPVSKSELIDYGISTKTGLLNGDAYMVGTGFPGNPGRIYTNVNYDNKLNGVAIYNNKRQGVILPGSVAPAAGNTPKFDVNINETNYILFQGTKFTEGAPDPNNIRITMIKDRSEDLKYIENTTKSTGKSIIKNIFAYFFGLDYSKLESGSLDSRFIQNAGGSSIYGDIESFAKEFTTALMEGEKFSERMQSYRSSGNPDPDLAGFESIVDPNERMIRIMNVKIERMCKSYFEGSSVSSDTSIRYKHIKAKTINFDLEKAKKVFTDNLVESVNEGFLTQEEIRTYINNSQSILEGVARNLDPIPGKFRVADKARSAIDQSLNTGITSKSEISPSDEDKMTEIILANANRYKLFLIFFAKFLRENPDVASQSIGISETLDWLSEGVPPDQKIFRDTHVVMSGTDIVSNRIIATTSQMYNNILLFSPSEIEVKESSDSDDENMKVVTIDEAETSWIPYPNFCKTGVDFNPYVGPEVRKQLQVRERNAETDNQRAALLINHLAEGMRPMYRGSIKIIGKHVKPYDLVFVADQFNDMFGFVEVERVVHNFSATEGWTTTITPHAYVVPIDDVQMVARRFDTKILSYMFIGLKVVDTALNLLMLYQIFLAPLRAGAMTAASNAAKSLSLNQLRGAALAKSELAKQVGKVGVDKAVKNTFLNMVAGGWLSKQQFMRPFVLHAEKVFTKAGVKASQEQINKAAVMLYLRASPDWMAKGEFIKAVGGQMLSSLGIGWMAWAYMGRDIAYDSLSAYATLTTDCQISSTTLPIHMYCLTKASRVYAAGLNTSLSRFHCFGDRLGYSMDNASAAFTDTIHKMFSLASSETKELIPDINLVPGIENEGG